MKFPIKFKFELVLLSILIGGYFIFRLPNLTSQPIFADEAIYIRWAQVMRAEPTLRFLPLSDGKTPLFMWAMIPLFKIFNDSLLAGRSLSVMSGFLTLIGVYFLSKKVFNTKTALWASLFYIITPYTVFFDRMALVDSMLAAFTVWVVFFAIWLMEKQRLDLAMILGYLLGGAVLTKTPGMVNLLILPISFIGFVSKKYNRSHLIKLILYWGVAIGIAFLMYNLLRLGPNFHLLSSRNADYIFSPVELALRPLDPFIPHLYDISDWFPKLFTWPILVLVGAGISYAMIRFNRLGLVILLWALIPILLSMAFLKTFTARYLLSSIPLFIILAGFGLQKIIDSIKCSYLLKYLTALVITLPMALVFNYQLLMSPPPVTLPQEERKGYFEEWTAGYGFFEIAQFLKEKRKEGKVVVGTEGFFGTLPDGLQIYLDKDDIAIIGSHATISAQIRNAALDNLTFFVGNKNRLMGSFDNAVLLKEYPKVKPLDGSKQDATVLYTVLP